MTNELCLNCGGKGFTKYFDGQILAHEDLAVKADFYKIAHCTECCGTGLAKRSSCLPVLVCIVVGWLVAAVILAQFWT